MRKTKEQNSKKKKLKTNNGITLIALVITIIVMLILVAVTISMAVNGGLFDYARRATSETKNSIDKEQELASGGVTIGGTYYNSIDKYINEEKTGEIEWETLLADANANPDKYLQQAAKAGQDIEENATIGIGTNGKVVNMDLWVYMYATKGDDYANPNSTYGYAVCNLKRGADGWYNPSKAYLGENFDNIIIPAYIKGIEDGVFIEVTEMTSTFMGCTDLENAPILPNSLKYSMDWDGIFEGCSNLKNVPILPNGLTNLYRMFSRMCKTETSTNNT